MMIMGRRQLSGAALTAKMIKKRVAGPGTEDYIPAGKVYLLEGWVTPEPEEVGSAYAV
jgi:hypothetical protein